MSSNAVYTLVLIFTNHTGSIHTQEMGVFSNKTICDEAGREAVASLVSDNFPAIKVGFVCVPWWR